MPPHHIRSGTMLDPHNLLGLEARIEVEFELRKAAYERISNLEEQLETLRRELGKVRDGVEVVHEEDVGMWAAGVLALAESSPAKKPRVLRDEQFEHDYRMGMTPDE